MNLRIAHLLGLTWPAKPKAAAKSTRASEPARAAAKKKAAAPPAKANSMKPKRASQAREIERRTLAEMKHEDQPPHTSFLHLLRATNDRSKPQKGKQEPTLRAEPPKKGLSKIARRTIVNCARLRGETLEEADIERRLREDSDRSLGITPETRAIFDRVNARKH